MANVVEVVITVDNAQAEEAVNRSIAGLNRLRVATEREDAAFRSLMTGSNMAADGFDRVSASAQRTSGHMASNLDGVRLLSQEFGLRLPRALESIISRMPALASAISGAVGGLAGIAAIEVIYRAGDAVYNLYQKYISLDAAGKQYYEQVQKHRDEEFVNPHSIEETTQRIKDATSAATYFGQTAERLSNSGWATLAAAPLDPRAWISGFRDIYNARGTMDASFRDRSFADDLDRTKNSESRELASATIDAAHAGSVELEGKRKINDELQKRLQLLAEEHKYREVEDHQPESAPDKLYDTQVLQAKREAAAQIDVLNRGLTEREIALQNEATNAALQGESLYAAQKKQAEDRLFSEFRVHKIEEQELSRLTAASDLKFDNERSARLQHLEEETRKLIETQQRAGLSGAPAISADLTAQLNDIEERRKNALSPDMTGREGMRVDGYFDRQRDSANEEATRKRQKLDADYTSYVDGQVSERLRNEMSAMQRVSEAQAQQHREAQKRYDDLYIRKDALGEPVDTGSDKNHADLARENAAIDQAATADRVRINQELHERTLQMERQSAEAEKRVRSQGLFGWADQYKQTVVEIEAQHSAMIAKIAEDERKNGGDWHEYAQQKVAADAEANAEIQEANQQLAHSISGMLETAFDGSMKSLEAKFRKMAFDMIGGFLAQVSGGGQQFGAGGPGTAHPSSATTGGFVSSALSSVMPMAARAGGSYATSPIGTMMHRLGFGGGFGGSSSTNAPAAATPGSRPFSGSSPTNGGAGSTVPAAISQAGTVGAGLGTGFGWGGKPEIGLTPDMANAATDEAQSGRQSWADNGEGGGFAGYMTGDPSMTSGGAAAFSPMDDDSVGAQAAAQARAGANLGGSGASAPGVAGGIGTAQSLVGAGLGAYTGARGMVGAFESGNASGALSGTTSGLELGASVGMLFGPAGAAIGGAIGAAAGAAVGILGDVTGEGGRLSGAKYYKATILPAMENAEQAYVRGTGGSSQDAVGQIDQIARQGFTAIAQKYGGSAASWVQSQYILKEQQFLTREIQQMASGGRDYMTRAAVQFHTGGTITGFGDLSTSSNEGFIHAMIGEKVANPSASSTHGSYIDAMNSGASERDVAAMYLRNTSAGSGAGGSTTIHQHGDVNVSALDTGGFESYLRSGGMDSIAKVENERASRYTGDSY